MSSLFLLPRNRDRIFRAIVNTEPADLIGYWPLDETSGTVARDYSGRGNNGAHVGVTLGYPGIGDGRTSPFYDGSTDYTNIYSAALAAAFNGAEGTLLVWVQVASAGVWTEGVRRTIVNLLAGGGNYITMYKGVDNRGYTEYRAGAVSNSRDLGIGTPLTWQSLAVSWSKSLDRVVMYLNAIQVGAAFSGLGVWAGGLIATGTILGANSLTPSLVWSGTEAHCALWSKALTLAQIANVSVV